MLWNSIDCISELISDAVRQTELCRMKKMRSRRRSMRSVCGWWERTVKAINNTGRYNFTFCARLNKFAGTQNHDFNIVITIVCIKTSVVPEWKSNTFLGNKGQFDARNRENYSRINGCTTVCREKVCWSANSNKACCSTESKLFFKSIFTLRSHRLSPVVRYEMLLVRECRRLQAQ